MIKWILQKAYLVLMLLAAAVHWLQVKAQIKRSRAMLLELGIDTSGVPDEKLFEALVNWQTAVSAVAAIHGLDPHSREAAIRLGQEIQGVAIITAPGEESEAAPDTVH